MPQDVIMSPEVQSAAKELLIRSFDSYSADLAVEFRNIFSISPEIIQSKEVQSAVKETAVLILKDPRVFLRSPFEERLREAIEICNNFDLQPEIVQSAAVEAIIYYLNGDESEAYFYAKQILDKFNLLPEVIKSPEVQSAAKKQLIKKLKRGLGIEAIEIRDKFNLTPEVILSPDVR
ncbi:MAG: hypothetical protein UX09_C0011G0021, partial [Candidatus Uhrbacteria bacterium GW2011_GWE2_45_35]